MKVLDTMAKTLDQYIIWWNWMSMSTTTQMSTTDQLKVNFSTLRERAVASRWESIREGFVRYTLKVSRGIASIYVGFR